MCVCASTKPMLFGPLTVSMAFAGMLFVWLGYVLCVVCYVCMSVRTCILVGDEVFTKLIAFQACTSTVSFVVFQFVCLSHKLSLLCLLHTNDVLLNSR